jgi:hypothetical protein
VHAERCAPYAAAAEADAGGRANVPDALARRLLSLRAYDAQGLMRSADVVDGRALAARAARLFADDAAVVVVHVHHARPGCFACRIER